MTDDTHPEDAGQDEQDEQNTDSQEDTDSQQKQDFEHLVKDSAYAAVGLAVLGIQKAAVRRKEVTEKLAARGIDLDKGLHAASDAIKPGVDAVRPKLEALRPQLEGLRPQADALGAQVNAKASNLKPQLEALGASVANVLKSLEDRAPSVRENLDAKLDGIEDRIPDQARGPVNRLRSSTVPEDTLRWLIDRLSPSEGGSEERDGEGGGAGPAEGTE